jgi:hypothetical protein
MPAVPTIASAQSELLDHVLGNGIDTGDHEQGAQPSLAEPRPNVWL